MYKKYLDYSNYMTADFLKTTFYIEKDCEPGNENN